MATITYSVLKVPERYRAPVGMYLLREQATQLLLTCDSELPINHWSEFEYRLPMFYLRYKSHS